MKIKSPKEWLTKEEYNRLVNNLYISRKDEMILTILYGCALRVSELSNLNKYLVMVPLVMEEGYLSTIVCIFF